MPVPMQTLLLAAAVDNLTSLVYVHADKKAKKPERVVASLLGMNKGKEDAPGAVKTEVFNSVADYEATRRSILEGVKNRAER